ncbi:uncharacterized protein LOC128271087 [Anopheles cruzii]|uniref:uncharacterized protein LOC128271087 n=1 Tax=Anopheles cruzii TaxID=68878 RepID=UPI0022EC4575|nr:uncharacterized protein LOC128271087 [Anopheles cruzii]
MRLLLCVLTILSLLAGIGAVFQGGVLDLNFFRCMWTKNYECPHEDIRFFLYTPTFRKGKVIDMNKPKTIFKAGFNTNQQTAIIIHGFNGTQTSRHIMFLKDAYLSRKFNVFAVDWEVLSQYPCYLSSLSNTKLVSQCTAQLYSFLTFAGCTSKQITCVGHSLGAHICGMMSNHLTKKQYRIIGLDPARPLIEKHASTKFRLTRDDARSVQIIHTNAGLLGQSAFTGRVDFCINGGQVQPYCEGDRIKQARCSHFLSVCYLANAILAARPMRAVRCPSGCVPDNRIPFVKSNRVRLKWVRVGQDTPGKMVLLLKVVLSSMLISGGVMIYAQAQHLLAQALFLGDPDSYNNTREDCVWKRGNGQDQVCPDQDIQIFLYTSGIVKDKFKFDHRLRDWLNNTEWDHTKENIILIHGYAGGDDTLPIAVLRDAYINHGGYNVFLVDWGALCQPPCYVAAVYNIRPVATCLAQSLMQLRDLGLPVERTTCVGHSLGAHICGLMANYLNFRMERIIALDPARPLIKPGGVNRLDQGDAKYVQVIHTNAGHYGEGGRVGHIDFCVNGGRRQPYCGNSTNINLCSHIWAICYLAQSLYEGHEPMAEPCSRRCPSNAVLSGLREGRRRRFGYAMGYAIPMGLRTPPKNGKSNMSAKELLLIWLAIAIGARAHDWKIGPCQVQFLEPCTSKTIAFYVFSSDHPNDGPILLDSIDPRVPEHISLNLTNKLIVHGYGGSIDFNATKKIRKAYLRQPHTNVFIVDWGKLSRLPCYPTAAFNTKQAGECTATFLLGLQANHPEFSSRELHAIGFSLGAHVLSFTSNALEKSIGVRFKRITGLDPALPFFATARPHWKLDQGDADFVDVIHTNAGVYGKIETCGHVDFYMNGGQNQPGCENDPNQPLCSHKMAAAYFAESINSKHGFWATRCTSYFAYFFGFCKYRVDQQQQQQSSIAGGDSRRSRSSEEAVTSQPPVTVFGENNNEFDSDRILMGEHCSETVEGVYFVATNPEPPYAMGFY